MVADGQEPQLFLLRGIREMQGPTLDTLATMLIEVDFPALVEQYRGAMTRLGSPLQCAIYRDGVCLYASNEAVSALQPGANGYTRMKLDGQDMLCVRYTGTDGMQYVTLVDYGSISRRVFAAVCITALVILAATVLAMVVSGWLMTNVLNHLQVLLEKFNDFAATGRPVSVTDLRYQKRLDEIGSLHRRFDWMTREWDRMTREREEQQRLLQEKADPAAAGPDPPAFPVQHAGVHLLPGPRTAGDERIATMTDALGKLLRASLNDKRDIVTVAEDLQITREYLRIQLIRYGDRLQVEYGVEDQVMDCRIPAMTIQPLVENAIHHAAEHMLGHLHHPHHRPGGTGRR